MIGSNSAETTQLITDVGVLLSHEWMIATVVCRYSNGQTKPLLLISISRVYRVQAINILRQVKSA